MTKTNDIARQIKLLTAQKNEIDRKLRTLENARLRKASKSLAESRASKGQKVVKVETVVVHDQLFRDGDYRRVVARETFDGKVRLTLSYAPRNSAAYRVQRSFYRGTNVTIKA